MLIVSLGWCFWLDTTGRAKVVVFERLSTGADTLTNGHWGWLMTSLGWHGTFQQPLSRARFLMATDTHTHTCRYTHGVMEEQQLYRALLYTCLFLCVCPSGWHRAASVKSVYTVWTTQNSHTNTHTEGENERERDRERGKEKGKRRGERHRWKVRERQREKVGSVALPSVH